MSNTVNPGIDEEEQRRLAEEAQRLAEQQAAEAQANAQAEAQKAEENARAANEAAQQAAARTEEAAKKAQEQGFNRTVQEKIHGVEVELLEAGDIQSPVLSSELEEELNKKNRRGELGYGTSWGATNEVAPDYSTIRDNEQAVFLGTLVDPTDRMEYFKQYAKQSGQNLEDVLAYADERLGTKIFATPQSQIGKIKAYNQGLANQGLMDVDGNLLDMNTATQAQIEQALRLLPDQAAHKDALAYYSKLCEARGWTYDKDSLGFMDSADLTQKDYNDAVDEYNKLFTIGYTSKNERAYLEELVYIQQQGYKPRIQKQMEAALKKSYEERSGKVAPSADEIRAVLSQEEADGTAQAGGRFSSFGQWLEQAGTTINDALDNLFSGKGEAKKAEPDPLIAEEEEKEVQGPQQQATGNTTASSYAAAGEGMASAMPVSSYAASSEPEAVKEVQGPTYQAPEILPEDVAGIPEVQGPAQQEQPVEQKRYYRDIAYDPNMTDEQAFSLYMGGGSLDARNLAQIDRFINDPAAMGLVYGMNGPDASRAYAAQGIGVAAPGTGGYVAASGATLPSYNAVDKFSRYGKSIGAAANILDSGSLPEGIRESALLDLMSVEQEIRSRVSDPRNGISIPNGQNMYDYVLSLDEGLANRVAAVSGAQKQVNEIYAENALAEKQAHQTDIENWKAAILAGNGTPEMLAAIAAETDNTYIDISEDEMYWTYKAQLRETGMFFSDGGKFWQGGSAAAQEGNNLRAMGKGGYGEYKSELKAETERVLEEYTMAAARMGMTLEDYLGSAGIDSLDQVIGIAYNNMQAVGNAYANDPEAQQAAYTVAEQTQSVGGFDAAVMGAEHGVKSYGESFFQTSYMMLDAATYAQTVVDLQDQYRAEYGAEAPQMYYNDLMAYIESGALSQESAAELLANMNSARNIFDVGYEIDPGFLKGLLRTGREELGKDVEALEVIAQSLPENERRWFNGLSGLTYSLTGMGVSTLTGGVGRSALLGSAVGWGMPEFASSFDENRAKGMSPGMAGKMAFASATATTLLNMGGTGSQIDTYFGDTAYAGMKSAFSSKGGIGLVKQMAKHLASQAHQEGMEEVAETFVGYGFDLLDDAALAYDRGENPKLSMMFDSVMRNLYETDVASLGKEVLSSYGMGVAYGGIFSLGGVAKSGLSAARGVKMQRNYASIDTATKMIEGDIPFTDDNVGKVYAQLQKDLQDPKFRRWIDSAQRAAREQNNMLTAAMLGAGTESRKSAVAEAERAADYKEKAVAAKSAAETATNRWVELRQQVMNGDLSAVPMMTTAQQQMGKAHTAHLEASNAAQKSEAKAAEKMKEWLAACGTYKSQFMQWKSGFVSSQRMNEALKLSAEYEAEEAAAAEAEQLDAAAVQEVDYAEGYVFADEEVDVPEIANAAPYDGAEEAVDSVIMQQDAINEAIESGDAENQVGLSGSFKENVKKAIDKIGALFDRAYEIYNNIGDSNAYNEVAKRYNALVERLKAADIDTGDMDALPVIDEAMYTPVEEEPAPEPHVETFAEHRAGGADAQSVLSKAREETATEVSIDPDYAEQIASMGDEEALNEAKTLVSDLKSQTVSAVEAIDGGMDDDTILEIAKNINETESKIEVFDSVMAEVEAEKKASEEYAYAKENLGKETAAAIAWPTRVRRTLSARNRGKKKVAPNVEVKQEAASVTGNAPAETTAPTMLSAEGEAILEGINAKRVRAKAKELEAKRKADAKAAANEARQERVYELTGAGNKPERQAKQINHVVEDESSTVEDIDRTIDRIEGVSMSMADEPASAETSEPASEEMSSKFSDPVMQKLERDLYKNWGIRLRTADLDPRDEGFYDRESNTIVLNKRLTSGEKQRTVVMHELIHFCEGQAWYPQFKKDILAGAYSGEAEIEENRQRLRDMGYGENELDFELVAHAAKPLFEGDELLIGNLLSNGKVPAIKRAYAAVSQYLARRKAKKMGMGKQYEAFESARKMLAQGLKDARATQGIDARHMYVGQSPDGKSIYESNFPAGTSKADKQKRLINLWQNVWSQKPIELNIKEDDGSVRSIIASFDPDYDPTNVKKTDLGKVMSNKNGSGGDRNVTLNLADDLYDLARTSVYMVSEDEHGKNTSTHQDIKRWHYFFNDIIYRGDNGDVPYTVWLDVKEKSDGGYVYQLYAKKTKKGVPATASNAHQNPLAGISQSAGQVGTVPQGLGTNAAGTPISNTNIPQNGTGVNSQSMQNRASHSYSDMTLSQYGNETAQEIDWINQAVKDQLKGSMHEVRTDRSMITETMQRIEDMGGTEEALNDLMSRPPERWNADDHAMAQVLMAKAEYDGDITTEAMVAMIYDRAGSEAGLVLQKRKLLSRMNAQTALALAAKLSSKHNMKNGGSSQYAPVGNGKPLVKIGENDPAGKIIDRAKRLNNAILKERGMDDIVERENRWGIPLTGAQMYLIDHYKLSKTDLPGIHYNQATLKQRMLSAILATDTDVVYDVDMDGNRNGLLGLIQQLEAMKNGKAVQTIADLTYIANQMAEMKAQSNGSEDPYLNTKEAQQALARAYDAINNVVPVTLGQKLSALAYMNMLSASTTGVKNVLGNVVMGPMEAASEAIATGIDKVVSGKTGNRTTTISSSAEVAKGLREGLAEAAQTIADTYVYQADTSQSRRYDVSGDAPRVFQNRLMEGKRRFVDMVMQLGDRPFFRAEYSRQLDMIKRLSAEGKMKKKDVTTAEDGRQVVSYSEMTEADMHKEAAQRALERVFQEDDAIVNWVNSAPANLRPFLQAVIPFVKTPTNIAKRMLDYTPVGLAKTLLGNGIRAAKHDGSFDQRRFVMGVGRGLTGTGMIMAGALLSSLGALDIGDGYGEEDDSALYGAGMANYDPYGKHLIIDGNKVSVDWLGAAGIWMTIGAAAANEWDNEDMGLGEKMYTVMLKSGPEILNLLFDNTMLSSASDLLGGAEDGEKLGANIVKTVTGSTLQQMLSPADIRQFAKFTDEYERDYRNDNPVIEAINKNVIRYWPVLRQTLPIKYDMTGDPVRQSSKYGWGREDENAVLNFMNMYMSPTNIQSDKGDKALDELIDLSYRLGDTGCIPKNLITTSGKVTIPSAIAKKSRMDTASGENKLVLTADEQRRYNQMYASLCFNGTENGRKYEKVGVGSYGSMTGIRDLIDSRSYERMDDKTREEKISEIMKLAKEMVMAQIVIDRGLGR